MRRLTFQRSGTGPVAQPVFKTGPVVQPTAWRVRLPRRSVYVAAAHIYPPYFAFNAAMREAS
jgi:hypothetical protein